MSHPTSSPEPRTAAAHNLALANQFGAEFRSVECEIDVEVDAVEGTLWRVHALKVLLEILAGQVGGECNDFLDPCVLVSCLSCSKDGKWHLRGSFVYSGQTSSSHA